MLVRILIVAVLALIAFVWQGWKHKIEVRSLKSQLNEDELTGLFNKRFLDQSLHREMERAIRANGDDPLSVLFIDGDSLKQINDIHGHEAGDKALKNLADVLKDRIRNYDIAARKGGDEFVVILPNTAIVAAVKIAEDIRATVEKKTEIKVSIGVSNYPESCNADSWEKLLKDADDMMYRAKTVGNKVVSALS